MKMSEMNPEEEIESHIQVLTSDEAMYIIRISLTNTIVDFSKRGYHPESRELKGMRTLLRLFNEMQVVSEVQKENLESHETKENKLSKKDKKTWNKLLSDMDILDK